MLVYWIHMVRLAIGLASLQMCHSSGMLSIQLIEYNNKQHRIKNGDCCDTLSLCSWDFCDNYFKICVTEKSQNECNLGKIETKVLGDDKITFPGIGGDLGGGHTNPLVFKFQTWRGFTLSIDIWDHDSGALRGNHDFVDSIDLDIQDPPDPDSQSAVTNRKRMKSTTSPSNRYLDLDIKVYCTNNSLVPDCSRQCIPRDDFQGHYTCDYVIGRVVCNANWYGDRCTKYCRPKNDTHGNYMCDNFGEKNCSERWFGGNCSKYCKNRDDRNGHYQCEAKTGRKVCLSNWYGEDCLVYCIARDDTEGHYSCNSTSGERVCLGDWFGVNCTKHCLPQDDVSLGHYTCDVSGNKVCLPGWQGDNCTREIPPTEVFKSMETLHSRYHTAFHHSNTTNSQSVSSRLEAGISTVFYSKFNTYILSSTILSVLKDNTNHESPLNSSANHFSAVYDLATIRETSSAVSSPSHSTKYFLSFTTQDFNTKNHNSNPSSFPKKTAVTLVGHDRTVQAIRTSNIYYSIPSSIFVAESYKSGTNKAPSITGMAATTDTTIKILRTTTEKYSQYSSRQEGKTSSTHIVLPTSNVELGNSNSFSSNIRTTRIRDTGSLGNSEEIKHGIFPAPGQVISTISQSLLPSTASFKRFQTSKVSNDTPGLSLKPSYQSQVAFSLSDGTTLYTGLPKTSQKLTVTTKRTTVSSQPDGFVSKKLVTGTTLINISERFSRSMQITPSTVLRSAVVSSNTKIAEAEEIKQTLKFFLYLQTEVCLPSAKSLYLSGYRSSLFEPPSIMWRQDNKKQLESSLRQHLKTMYGNTPNENIFRFHGVNVSTAKECQNVVLLDVDISFVKANRFHATLPPFIQRDIQLLIKNELNASEIISRNATQELLSKCTDGLKEDQTNKTYLVLAVILFTFLLLAVAVGVGVCIIKIKKRKRKIQKVYPECWALATKQEDAITHVPSTLGSRSSQVRLYLEEL